MTKKRRIIVEILDNLIHLAFLYGVFATILFAISRDPQDVWRAGLIAVPFAVNFILRRVSRIVIVSIIVHAIVPIGAWFMLPLTFVGVAWMIATAVLAVYSVQYPLHRQYLKDPFRHLSDKPKRKSLRDWWLPESEMYVILERYERELENEKGEDAIIRSNFAFMCAIVLIPMALWATAGGHWPLAAIYPFIMVFVVIGQLIFKHMVQMDRALAAIQLLSDKPVKKIISFDYKAMAGLAALLIGVTIVLNILVVAPSVNTVVSLFPPLSDFQTVDDGPAWHGMTGGMSSGMGFGSLPDSDPSPLMLFAGYTLRVVIGVVVAILLAILAFLVLRGVLRFLTMRSQVNRQRPGMEEKEIEREFVLTPDHKRRVYKRSKEHPLRRRFRETAQKHIEKGVPIIESDTPTDMANRIQEENIGTLAEDYSKVRYR